MHVTVDNVFLASGAASIRKAPTGLIAQNTKYLHWFKKCAAGPFLCVIQQEQACLTTRCLCCNMWGPLVWQSRHGLGNWLSMLAPVNFYQTFLHLGKTTADFTIWPWPMALHGCTTENACPGTWQLWEQVAKATAILPWLHPSKDLETSARTKKCATKQLRWKGVHEQHTKPASNLVGHAKHAALAWSLLFTWSAHELPEFLKLTTS